MSVLTKLSQQEWTQPKPYHTCQTFAPCGCLCHILTDSKTVLCSLLVYPTSFSGGSGNL